MDRGNKKENKGLIKKILSLRNQINNIYKDTYSTDPNNREELDSITSKIEDNISKIVNRNGGLENLSNISKLYSVASLKNNINNKDYVNSVVDFFENSAITDAIIGSYSQNKWIKELNNEIDVVCKYMPKLEEALDAIKDSVLCADNYEKETLMFSSTNISPNQNSIFNEDIKIYMKQYNLVDKVESWYNQTSKYGEALIYNVPYNKALSILLDRKNNNINSNKVYQELSLDIDSNKEDINIQNIKLEINKSSVLQSVVNEITHFKDILPIVESSSITESSKFDTVLSDKFEYPEELEKTSQDGFINSKEQKKKDNDKKSSLKVPGLLLKSLKSENTIFLYMDDICLGYYYLEFLDNNGLDVFSDSLFNKKSLTDIGYRSNAKAQDMQTQISVTDTLLQTLASSIALNIDDKFINNNTYLKNEIYAILKYNDICNANSLDRIRVTYISPEDVEHITFNQDPDTHRGISDLLRSLISAKLWCCIQISTVIGILTRGQDKRVYYVKQNVEQNIAQTLLNVINQIKKNNFNIMQIENMNSILGITGKYNDFIIPVGPSGDAPISMEVMEGQNIDPQTELLDKLEEISINLIGIPYELVVARLNLDFATQLTMSNTKYMKFIFRRQSKFESHISNIMTKIYNTEKEDNINIQCILPSPIMLNINNLNQILELLQQQANTLAELEYPDDNDEDIQIKRKIFSKLYVRSKIGTYFKYDEIERIKTLSLYEYEISKKKKDTDNQDY